MVKIVWLKALDKHINQKYKFTSIRKWVSSYKQVNRTISFKKVKWTLLLKKVLLLEHLLVLKKSLLTNLFKITLEQFAYDLLSFTISSFLCFGRDRTHSFICWHIALTFNYFKKCKNGVSINKKKLFLRWFYF